MNNFEMGEKLNRKWNRLPLDLKTISSILPNKSPNVKFVSQKAAFYAKSHYYSYLLNDPRNSAAASGSYCVCRPLSPFIVTNYITDATL